VESGLRASARTPQWGTSRVLDRLLHHTIYGRPLDAIYWSLGALSLLLLLVAPPDFPGWRRFR
jgi:hypothetical protein